MNVKSPFSGYWKNHIKEFDVGKIKAEEVLKTLATELQGKEKPDLDTLNKTQATASQQDLEDQYKTVGTLSTSPRVRMPTT